MKNRNSKKDAENKEKINVSKSISMKKKKKNMMSLGGAGLSLEAFANAKSANNHYNPALIKKQREFYKNAKYVSKFKKKLKQQSQQSHLSADARLLEDDNETGEGSSTIKKNKMNKKNGSHSLRELYERQREEEEKARTEREAIIKAKKEEREKAEARRKAVREKMLKKTRYGQPVMKYRIEHLLQSIQGSN